MAEAAVTLPFAPLFTSRLLDVSFISSTFRFMMDTYRSSSRLPEISRIRFSVSSPCTCTKGLLRSVNSSSFTPQLSETKYRFRVEMRAFSRMFAARLSMYSCGSLHTATNPNPAGVPFSGKSTSSTTGYFPWSYQPRSA